MDEQQAEDPKTVEVAGVPMVIRDRKTLFGMGYGTGCEGRDRRRKGRMPGSGADEDDPGWENAVRAMEDG